MNKKTIFEKIVNIMQNDSSTKKDIQGSDPNFYREKINQEMDDEDFYYLLRCYLASFGVIGHVSIKRKDQENYRFLVRRYNNSVYVLKATKEIGIEVGDEIIQINQYSISEYYDLHKDFFVSEKPDRQFQDWSYLIDKAKDITLIRNGLKIRTKLTQNHDVIKPDFQASFINSNTYYIKLEDFYQSDDVNQIYNELNFHAQHIKNLIVDVRINYGGMDSLYLPLLQYFIPSGKRLKDLKFETGSEFLYTKNNVNLRLKEFEKYLSQSSVDDTTKQLIENFSKTLLENQDKGFVVSKSDDSSSLPDIAGIDRGPEKIFILTDVYCRSSGDSFVELAKEFDKVKTIGRPTLGILDYSNCCSVELGDYQFTFPTSRSLAIDQEKGMNNIGIIPEIEIPWTIEHLKKDVDLEYIMQELISFD